MLMILKASPNAVKCNEFLLFYVFEIFPLEHEKLSS